MPEYTPTEARLRSIRHGWASSTPGDYVQNAAEFDRFVAEVKRDVWDECVQALAWATDNGPDPLRYVAENSPYRKGQS